MNQSRAARFQRDQRRVRTAGAACGLGILALFGFTPLGSALESWLIATTAVWPAPLGAFFRLVAFVACVVAAAEVAVIAVSWVFARPAPGSDPAARGTAASSVFAAALAIPAGIAAACLVKLSVSVVPAWWWLAAGVLVAAALVAALHLAPGWLARVSGARPVERPALVERLGALARRVRVEILSIDEVPAEASVTATALVAGVGASRRVFISSELLRHWTDEEIAVVVAHELGHHANHDLWHTLLADTALLSMGFLAAHATGMAGAGELAALPRIALGAGAVFLAATPLRHAMSRRQERNADAFALRLTGGVEEFRTAIRRLAARHLAEERPSRWTRWFFHRHPSVSERLAFAESFSRSQPARPSGASLTWPKR